MKLNLRSHLQLRMLRAIVAINEQQSLLKASSALGITQPALTRTLRDIETILGAQIFERHPRGVTPTAFGTLAAEAAQRILAEIDRLEEEVAHFHTGKSGVVSIGAMAPAAVGVLPGYFSFLRACAPDLEINVRQGTIDELTVLLERGEVSFIIGRLYPPPHRADRFEREPLYFERVSILARSGHPLFSEPEISIPVLAGYAFVLPTMSHQVESEFETLLTSLGLSIEVKSAPLTFLRELLHSSDCLTISPPQSMGGDIRRGSIAVIPFEMPGPPRPAGVLLRSDRVLNKQEQRVLALLRRYILDTPAFESIGAPARA